jgi:hypothetical protein
MALGVKVAAARSVRHETRLPGTRIFWFWVPLAAMWIVMALEHPMITAVIARIPNAEINLAAFGLSFSLALIMESPIIMLFTAATALARDESAYRTLLRFTNRLSLILTLLHLLIALTPAFELIVRHLIGAPAEIIVPARRAFLLMFPWSASIAYRRLWQGVLIRFKRTGVVPFTLLSRLLLSLAVMAAGFAAGISRGAEIGAVALSLGSIASAGTAYAFYRPVGRRMVPRLPGYEPLSRRKLLSFYIPLAMTTMITMLGQPLVAIGLARAAEPLASLAVWPVLLGVIFLGRSLGLSYQEAVVALLEDAASFRRLKAFGLRLSLLLVLLMAGFAFSPAARFWFARVAGLSPRLAGFALAPARIMILLPGLEAILSFLRGVQVHLHRTAMITRSVLLNVGVLSGVLFAGIALLPLSGAEVAALALTAALAADCLFLAFVPGTAVGAAAFGTNGGIRN